MCYKEEVQKRNEEILQKKFDEENVPEFIQEFFLKIASRAARVNYYSTLKNFFEWLINNKYVDVKRIGDLTPNDFDKIRSAKIIKYFQYLKDGLGIKLTTLQTKKNQLQSFWTYLVQEHYATDNVVSMVKSEEYKPAKTNRRKAEKMPLPEDIAEMEDNINRQSNEFIRTRDLIILAVLRGTGLRVSELAGLDEKDVFLDDLNDPRPHILVISKGTYDYTDDGKDIVYLTRNATKALQEWFEYKKTLTNIETEAVFVNRNGGRLKEKDIKHMFYQYSGGKLTPHMMRHEYTTVLQRETNDPTFVQEQGRWKSQKIMTNVYDYGAERSADILQNM